MFIIECTVVFMMYTKINLFLSVCSKSKRKAGKQARFVPIANFQTTNPQLANLHADFQLANSSGHFANPQVANPHLSNLDLANLRLANPLLVICKFKMANYLVTNLQMVIPPIRKSPIG